jgi:hypothetical protein
MKNTVLFAAVIIAAGLVIFPSCSGGSGSSVSTGALEGIWVATGDDGGTAKAMLFEFSGNNFTRIAYTETPDPDMIQEEGSKGTYSISGTTLNISITQDWDDATVNWEDYTESFSFSFDLQGDTLMMDIPGLGELYFDKKSFSRPLDLIGTWYELPAKEKTLTGNGGGTYSYNDPGDNYTSEGTWTASTDLMRIVTTYENDDGTESTFYIENLYEYEISGTELELSWDGTVFSSYSSDAP